MYLLFIHRHIICSLKGASVAISGPEGPFTLRSLRDVTHLYLLAAGTGFTPMARLLCLALQDLPSVRLQVTHTPTCRPECNYPYTIIGPVVHFSTFFNL